VRSSILFTTDHLPVAIEHDWPGLVHMPEYPSFTRLEKYVVFCLRDLTYIDTPLDLLLDSLIGVGVAFALSMVLDS